MKTERKPITFDLRGWDVRSGMSARATAEISISGTTTADAQLPPLPFLWVGGAIRVTLEPIDEFDTGLHATEDEQYTMSSSSDDARIDELTDMIEDLAGNLEDAADTIERAAQAILPGVVVRDVESYRETARKARRLV